MSDKWTVFMEYQECGVWIYHVKASSLSEAKANGLLAFAKDNEIEEPLEIEVLAIYPGWLVDATGNWVHNEWDGR